jgi:hypothetical protein
VPRPVSELNTSAGKALLPGFADDDDSEDLVGNTIGEVKGLFQDCERKLKELIKTKSEGSQDEVSDSHPSPARGADDLARHSP